MNKQNKSAKSVLPSFRFVSLRAFIREFNFAEPSWENTPEEFPNCDTSGLSVSDRYLFDAIKIAYFVNEGGWKKSAVRTGLICLIGLIGLISLISSNAEPLARTVSAASVKADEVIQSTVSAILKNKER